MLTITCRALDEGFNVPETEVGIIAASTATRRQRIQRLGRVLRPVKGKETAVVYSLVATEPEIKRLREEETDAGCSEHYVGTRMTTILVGECAGASISLRKFKNSAAR